MTITMVGASDILCGKILIVDDQQLNVTLLERMLQTAGGSVSRSS